MSDSDEIVVCKRRTNRLNLDSEEEARVEAEQQQKLDDIRARKEEKKRRRDEQARQVERQEQQKIELERHFEDPKTMIEPDSDSKDHFQRAEKKIRKSYPDFKVPKQHNNHRRKMISESDDDDSDSGSQDQSSSSSESASQLSSAPKQKKIKKQVKKERKREQHREENRIRHKERQVKVEEKDPKETLIGEVASRWWYCMPEWPPTEFNYEEALNKQGYRLVDISRFRMQENIVNGLTKATPIEGFVGYYKTLQKLVDVRPKELCPTLNSLRRKTVEQLMTLLHTALKEQIREIGQQKYQASGDAESVNKMTRRLAQLR